MAVPGDHIDGYRLVRPIGRGGFGTVWLCQVEATQEFKALKILPASDSVQLERELAALIRYRAVASQLQCPYLVPIEHVNRTENELFYTMPLADDLDGLPPDDPTWRSKTLAVIIQERKTAPTWFTSEEIHEIFVPLLSAVQSLSDVGIVHRDIKPENILFISGCSCLGDVSLLSDDAKVLTRCGTPGYAAPSWYLKSGGNPDMWGLATTLFAMITGNPPDKLGRAAFLWPPQGLRPGDLEKWNRYHRAIFRGTNENTAERFAGWDAFAEALEHVTKPPPFMICGVRPAAVVRDAVIVWGLPCGVSVVLFVAGINTDSPNFMTIAAVANTIFGIIGYVIVGCLVRQSRWRHMLVVSVVVWLLDLINLLVLGTFAMWLFALPVLLVWMAIGGGIASFMTRSREISRKRPKSNMKLRESVQPTVRL